MNTETKLEFKALQNGSNHGCDACAIDVENKTIWVADAKSSQNGVDATASAVGDPEMRLDGWLKQSWASGENASPENKVFAEQMKDALAKGYQVKGLTVKIGVPAPGTTGQAEIKILPWSR